MSYLIISWVACGIVSYGMTVNYFQRAYPTLASEAAVSDRVGAALMGLFGPITLLASLLYFTVLRSKNVPLGWKL